MVGLVIEHVCDKRPLRNCSGLAVNLALVGERLREPRRGKRLGPDKDALIKYFALRSQEPKRAKEISPGLRDYVWTAREARHECKIAIGNVIEGGIDRLEERPTVLAKLCVWQ